MPCNLVSPQNAIYFVVRKMARCLKASGHTSLAVASTTKSAYVVVSKAAGTSPLPVKDDESDALEQDTCYSKRSKVHHTNSSLLRA